MASNVCWGIEVGAGAIKAVKLEADGDGVAVRDFAVINHPKVLSTPELDQSDALRMALGTLSNQYDLSKAILAVSVPGHQSFARFAKLPPVEPKKVPDIVKFEAVQQIPFPLEEVEWDYQTFVSPDSPDIEVGIFAVTRARIMEQLGTVGEFGLTPEIATLGPVAAYNALAYDLEFTEDTPGTIILDIGTTATDLIIAEAGRVWVRTFPLGGHQFTDALVTSFKLSYSKAERLKREAEQTKHARHVFQAMRPVFTDLVQEVQRSIGYYQSVHAGADLKRLIGLGNTFRLPGLRKYLKQQLHMDVYRIEGFKRVTPPEGKESEFNDASLNLSTAYGLALQGLDSAALRANVMPVPVVRETMWKQKRVWFGLAAGVAAAAGAGFFVRPLMDMTAMNAVTEPSEIQRVSSTGSRLKSEAEQAGVLGDATGDTTAATLLELLDGRGIYAHLANDMGAMLTEVRSDPLVADEERRAPARDAQDRIRSAEGIRRVALGPWWHGRPRSIRIARPERPGRWADHQHEPVPDGGEPAEAGRRGRGVPREARLERRGDRPGRQAPGQCHRRVRDRARRGRGGRAADHRVAAARVQPRGGPLCDRAAGRRREGLFGDRCARARAVRGPRGHGPGASPRRAPAERPGAAQYHAAHRPAAGTPRHRAPETNGRRRWGGHPQRIG
jgi:type IV pilus assembly protein PilM